MLNQAELNFYGYNSKNIIQRQKRGRVEVKMRYDAQFKKYVVERRTPRTLWVDRYDEPTNAKRRYNEFLYLTNKQLERMLTK